MEKSIADEIAQISMDRPHVVLLGAGASRAAFPDGERQGRRLPVMADFLKVVPVGDVLAKAGVPATSNNFEDIYSNLASEPKAVGTREALEGAVFDYFDSLSLPDVPTLYDHLILSLRPKDVIATFNWDPFLIQAVRRNRCVGDYPRILFLHGNVLQGYCENDKVHGVKGVRCSRCKEPFSPVPLLYPIFEKNYEDHPAIRATWEEMHRAFENAFMVTIFGYGAPQSDRAAIDLLNKSWGGWEKRQMEQFEIIDIREEDSLVESWQAFIHTHHYEIHTDFYESWIAKHPRRTGEAYLNQYVEAAFIEDNPVPRTKDFRELWSWYEPLLKVERDVEPRK